MNSSQDRHIGTLWAEHFPKHHTDLASRSICLTVLHIVQNKAQLSLPLAGTVHKLNYVLATFGIPENEFQEMNGKDPLQAQIILRLFSSRSKTRCSESVKPEWRGPMLLGPVTTVKVNNHAYDPSPMISFKWMEGGKRLNAIEQVRRKIPENETRIRDIEPDTYTDQRARYAKLR